MTEAEARAALRAFVRRRWDRAQDRGAALAGDAGRLDGGRRASRLAPVAGGVRVAAFMGKEEPAVWVMPGRHCNPAM